MSINRQNHEMATDQIHLNEIHVTRYSGAPRNGPDRITRAVNGGSWSNRKIGSATSFVFQGETLPLSFSSISVWQSEGLLINGLFRSPCGFRKSIWTSSRVHGHQWLMNRLPTASAIPVTTWITPDVLSYHTRGYPKVSGLAAWSKNCNWCSSLPLGAVASLFSESV